MSNPRDEIFRSITLAKTRVANARPQHIIPAQGQLNDDRLFNIFCDKVKGSSATIATIKNLDLVPEAATRYLNGLEPSVYSAEDTLYINNPELATLNWQKQSIRSSTQPNAFNSKISITQSVWGIAETGSVTLQSGPQISSATYFLPDVLILVIYKTNIVANQEAVWQQLLNQNPLPRTFTLATGPSRTGDIEQKLVIGAHGPRHEHILVIDND